MKHWIDAAPSGDQAWEAAYRRFETSEQEISKFTRRLKRAGAELWPKNAVIVELFCGRGNGLETLQRLGFVHVEGVDRSASLLAQYRGPAQLYVGDCRELRFEDASKDAVVIHGGLHHLALLPDDLERVLREVRRVLRPSGRLVAVEPWATPFLRVVHVACGSKALRNAWSKLDALAVMIEHERDTYEQWLGQPKLILELLNRHFVALETATSFGKLMFIGSPRE